MGLFIKFKGFFLFYEVLFNNKRDGCIYLLYLIIKRNV